MRKILSGFLATSMIVAVASSVTFAASARFEINVGTIECAPQFKTDNGADITGVVDKDGNANAGTVSATITIDSMEIGITTNDGNGVIVVPLNVKADRVVSDYTAVPTTSPNITGTREQVMSTSQVQNMLAGKKFSSVRIGQKLYSGHIEKVSGSTNVRVVFEDEAMGANLDVNSIQLNTTVDYETSDLILQTGNPAADTSYHAIASGVVANLTKGAISDATGNRDLSDVERSGMFENANINIADVVICDGDGRPVPMTETGSGVDKDANGENGVQSGNTVYFMINDQYEPTFADDTFWKLKVTKGDNSKMIKAISDVTKTFSKPLHSAYYDNAISNIDFTKRHRYIKVELNEIYTDDEYKISLDMRLSPKTKAVERFSAVTDDSEFKVKDFYFYMKNITKAADNDWRVGIGGLMLNPLENDWNEVTYFDEDGDVAFMKFFADSDVDKFYSKLSTKWEHADYASYFNDQDAFIFNFTGSPKMSSTSRVDLQIYSPFIDEDGNETIDPSTAVVYQVIDGDLYDVTDSFTYAEGENGDMAFTTRTRFLGTYIICEKAVEEAVADETVPDELTPDTDTTAPEDVTPDSNGGGKTPANTGKYL